VLFVTLGKDVKVLKMFDKNRQQKGIAIIINNLHDEQKATREGFGFTNHSINHAKQIFRTLETTL